MSGVLLAIATFLASSCGFDPGRAPGLSMSGRILSKLPARKTPLTPLWRKAESPAERKASLYGVKQRRRLSPADDTPNAETKDYI